VRRRRHHTSHNSHAAFYIINMICYRSDGHSRQFGFVGFKSAEDAQAALDYFNNSYLDTSRLNIQVSRIARDFVV
jgi:RNA recognition motif-containing protein